MPDIASDFADLLPSRVADNEPPWKGPLYLLWVFDPQDDKVILEHNDDRPRAEAVTHDDMAVEVTHPSRINGYVYKIKGGWRITDDEHRPLTDPHVKAQVEKALRDKYPLKPLPHIH
jgi:hypothetical protein